MTRVCRFSQRNFVVKNGYLIVTLDILLRNCNYTIETFIDDKLNLTNLTGNIVIFPSLKQGVCEVRIVSELRTLDTTFIGMIPVSSFNDYIMV